MNAHRLRLVRDLEWYLSTGVGKCYKSPMGPMLERAKNLLYDSNGHRIPAVQDSWQVMPVKRTVDERGYELEFKDLDRLGRVSRWLRRIDSQESSLCDVLLVYYGDRGSKWGAGELGRVACLYPLTKAGQKRLDTIRRKFPLSVELDDDVVLERDILDERRHSEDMRRRMHSRMRLEADVLLEQAHRLLVRVAA